MYEFVKGFLFQDTIAIQFMTGSYFCLDVDSSESYEATRCLFLTKFYYWLKISDLLDTVSDIELILVELLTIFIFPDVLCIAKKLAPSELFTHLSPLNHGSSHVDGRKICTRRTAGLFWNSQQYCSCIYVLVLPDVSI